MPNPRFPVPPEVEAVFQEFYTCELTTIGRDGTPIAWPVLPIYRPAAGAFALFTSIGLPQKVFNIRRNPKVSLLFSNGTGSGLNGAPAVLVQGEAQAPDEIVTSFAELDAELRAAMQAQMRRLVQRQPAVDLYTSNPLSRSLMAWYFIRLPIHVTPRRVLWWENGDFSRRPREMEVAHVG